MKVPTTVERVTVSVDEAAAMLGISRASAYEYVRLGRIRSVRMGRRILIPLRTIYALLGDSMDDQRHDAE